MDQIQKSIQLINFSDSVFDTDEKEPDYAGDFVVVVDNGGKVVDKAEMMTTGRNNEEQEHPECLTMKKYVLLDELIFQYFNQREEMDHEKLLMEIIVTYSPFLITENLFFKMIRRESGKAKEIEMKCFGTVLTDKFDDLEGYYAKVFLNYQKFEEFEVLCKRIPSQIDLKSKKFDAKSLAKTMTLLEASEYSKLNFSDFYGKTMGTSFVSLFNKMTNFLISEILMKEGQEERRVLVKRILKLAKELCAKGAMNSLKACVAALESSPIHRLQVIKDQSAKYQKRFKELSALTTAEKNFVKLREMSCIIPWLGIILRDFTFIKELAQKSDKVNVPLALCLRKLINSMTAAREACDQFQATFGGEEKRKSAVLKKWLESVEIKYESEEEQYERSVLLVL